MHEAYPVGAISYYVIHTLNSQGSEVPVANSVFQFDDSIIACVPEEKGEGIQSYLRRLYWLCQYSEHF
jgi:hypothetical protein